MRRGAPAKDQSATYVEKTGQLNVGVFTLLQMKNVATRVRIALANSSLAGLLVNSAQPKTVRPP